MTHDPNLPVFLQSFASRIRAVPGWIRILALLLAFGVAGYWAATDSGLYRVFRDGATHTRTEVIFYPRALVLSFAVVMIPITVVILGLSRIYERRAARST